MFNGRFQLITIILLVLLITQYDWVLFGIPFLELRPTSFFCKFSNMDSVTTNEWNVKSAPSIDFG